MFAYATIRGDSTHPNLRGVVFFKDFPNGVEVSVEVDGLPPYKPGTGNVPPIGPHGFHIHAIGKCEVTDPKEPFTSAGGHWNPTNQPHGNHAGDFPVLFSNDGYAKMTFFTNKFRVRDVIGKAAMIHENPDDYRTQPAGAAGKRIGCGVVRPLYHPSSITYQRSYEPYCNSYYDYEYGYNDQYDNY